MTTIAITIDESMLGALDELTRLAHANRSQIVRRAVGEFLDKHRQGEREKLEWQTWRKHIDKINEQAAALISDQAVP